MKGLEEMFKSIITGAAVAVAMLGTAYKAEAGDHWITHKHKHWTVSINEADDGSMWCSAQVEHADAGFYVHGDGSSVMLQFYNADWYYGRNTRYNEISFRIDRRERWYGDADFDGNSIVTDRLQDVDVLVEIAEGRKLYLLNDRNEAVFWYSLAGSKAAMFALIECVNKL